jgi:hypothetical protein
VSTIVGRAVKAALAVSVGLGIALLASKGLRSLLLDGYLLAVCAVLLLASIRATRASAPAPAASEFELALARMRERRPDTPELGLVTELELSTQSAFHLHVRLRPVLQEIAAHRLDSRHGIELVSEPDRARRHVGAAAWELVRPDRASPADRLAQGPPLSELARVVTELEQI